MRVKQQSVAAAIESVVLEKTQRKALRAMRCKHRRNDGSDDDTFAAWE